MIGALRGLRSVIPRLSKQPELRALNQFPAKHPFQTAGIALGGLGFADMIGAPLVKGVAEDFSNQKTEDLLKNLEFEKQQSAIQQGLASRQQAVEQEIAKQSARLAAANPHLYNQIIAGRRLPQGAVILGGNPRTDLMEQIASGMASNPQLQQPGPTMAPQDQFLNELGV